MKKITIFTLMLLTLNIFSVCAQEKADKNKPQNILFISIDDLKPLIGSYGYDQMVTPNIDKLASGGVLFENTHCQQAVCGPSRASLMTGMRPDYTGVWDLRTRMRNVNPDILSMPQYFQEQGYTTVAMGKIYDPRCVDKQYDKPSWSIPYKVSSEYTYPEEWGEPALSYYVSPEAKEIVAKLNQEAIDKGVKNKHSYISKVFKPAVESYDAPDDAYMDGQICNNALSYMDELSKDDKPFFLAVGFKRPHLPFAAPKKYWDLYNRDEVKLAEYQKPVKDGVDIAYHNHGELLSYTDIPPLESFSDVFTELISDDQQRELIHGYYASVSFIDAQVGKIMAKLKELGLEENTTVILWGDHGWHLGDHALWCKHTNFEQATHVPMIISTPNGEKGRYSHPVEFVDIFPTLCETAGVPTPEHLQGVSLLPAMKNTNVKVKEYAVSQFDRGTTHGYSLRTDRYRFTIWMKDGYRTFMPFDDKLIYDCELYDYDVDPLETQNLYRSKEHKAIADKMMGYFKDFVKTQNAELKNTMANPANIEEGASLEPLNIDGSFEFELTKSWKAHARNGAVVDFSIDKVSPISENTLKVDVNKLGKNPWDIGVVSKKASRIEKGKVVNMSFQCNGGKLKVILTSDTDKRIINQLNPGTREYLQRISFDIPETANYTLKFQFMEEGVYYIDEIKTEIE